MFELGIKRTYSELRHSQSGREYKDALGVPQTESRALDRMLAALEANLSFLTFPKKVSSLLTKNFSMDSSVSEFFELRFCSRWTNSAETPPSESVNEAMALLRGELDFSSTIEVIDSTEETRE
jgi:hypothetical protein